MVQGVSHGSHPHPYQHVCWPLCEAAQGLPGTGHCRCSWNERQGWEDSGGVCLVPKPQFFPVQTGISSPEEGGRSELLL